MDASTAKLLIIATAFACVSCDTPNTSDLHGYINQIKATPALPAAPLPASPTLAITAADTDNLPQLFCRQPRPHNMANSGKKQDLASCSISSLTLVGTISTAQGMQALIRSQNQTIYRLQKGDYLGLKNGQIQSISRDTVELLETDKDAKGVATTKQILLKLKKE